MTAVKKVSALFLICLFFLHICHAYIFQIIEIFRKFNIRLLINDYYYLLKTLCIFLPFVCCWVYGDNLNLFVLVSFSSFWALIFLAHAKAVYFTSRLFISCLSYSI